MAGLSAEEPPKEEKKKDEVKLDAAEEVKLGRGMAFQGFTAEQQEAWRPAKRFVLSGLAQSSRDSVDLVAKGIL